MKKVLFVLALVAVYGVSMAMSNVTTVSIDETVIVAVDADEKVVKEEGKKAATKTATKGEKPAEGCSGAKADAKAEGKACSGEKTAETKKACGSSCGGK